MTAVITASVGRIRRSWRRDVSLRQLSRDEKNSRIRAFARTQWPSLVVQVFLIAGPFVVFGTIPEQVVTLWIPDGIEGLPCDAPRREESNGDRLTFVWMVGIARQMMLVPGGESASVGAASGRG